MRGGRSTTLPSTFVEGPAACISFASPPPPSSYPALSNIHTHCILIHTYVAHMSGICGFVLPIIHSLLPIYSPPFHSPHIHHSLSPDIRRPSTPRTFAALIVPGRRRLPLSHTSLIFATLTLPGRPPRPRYCWPARPTTAAPCTLMPSPPRTSCAPESTAATPWR